MRFPLNMENSVQGSGERISATCFNLVFGKQGQHDTKEKRKIGKNEHAGTLSEQKPASGNGTGAAGKTTSLHAVP
ncbi:MAG: hypothetical protein LBR88_03180 [Zoogloeaceae bacterium]|jgi:hypothetical protein|nr:hypothetical protein [Zoogloeaceae bacterium]